MKRRNFMKRIAGTLAGMSQAQSALPGCGLPGSGDGASDAARDDNGIAPSKSGFGALLAQHDVAYLSPATRPVEGLPIGNGDTAALVWMPPSGMTMTINKSNLWDDQPAGYPEGWIWSSEWEEKATALVGGASLTIRNGTPLLDKLYLNDFRARLDLYGAKATIHSESPLGSVKASAWGCSEPSVLVLDYDETTPQPVCREIELSRWGSRRFFHWYSQYVAAATETGLGGTAAGADQDHIWIEQKLRQISFAVVARFVGGQFTTAVQIPTSP